MCLGYIYISVYNLLLSFALGCMVLGLSSRASVLPSLHSFRNCLDVVYWSLPCLYCFLLPTCPVAPFLSVEQVFFVAAASCHSCACCGCVGLVTGVVSILHPQFGSEWGCRCYTSCWCSYGFPLHLFFVCGFSGILFLGKVPFSTCCFRRCAVVGFRPLPFLLVCVCTLLCLCVTYLSLYVLVCILYIDWYFSFFCLVPYSCVPWNFGFWVCSSPVDFRSMAYSRCFTFFCQVLHAWCGWSRGLVFGLGWFPLWFLWWGASILYPGCAAGVSPSFLSWVLFWLV